MRFGYTRVSTIHQDDELQLAAIEQAGVDRVFSDTISGSTAGADRPALGELLTLLRDGDTVVVWRIDRLGRSLIGVVQTVQQILAVGASVHSVKDGIDPSSPSGRLLLHLLAACAEYELELIKERTVAGVAAAQARGVRFGRPVLDSATAASQREVIETLRSRGRTVPEIVKVTGLSRSTVYRRLADQTKSSSPSALA